jgi:hypothetical protein
MEIHASTFSLRVCSSYVRRRWMDAREKTIAMRGSFVTLVRTVL